MDILKNVRKMMDQNKAQSVKPKVAAVIVSAGRSERMGSNIKKQFLPLCGVPVIARTLAAFEASRLVSQVIVVTGAEDIVAVADMVREFGFDKVVRIVRGGGTRQESAAAGLAATAGADYIAVHDGARPLVSSACIDRVVGAAVEVKAASAAVRLKDTVKQCDDDGNVIFTPDRNCLWAVQTPQVFEYGLYRQALDKALEAGADYTDDCQLIEHFGGTVRLVDGEYTNIKITTKDDVIFAEAILRARGEA